MKWMLYIMLAALALAVPVRRADVGKLRPVEVIAVGGSEVHCIIRTDKGDRGVGATLEEAAANLRDTAPGLIYLDTAEYLLITGNALHLMPEITKYLKGDISVCLQDGPLDPSLAVNYLAEQTNLPKLRSWKKGSNMPILQEYNKRLIFLEKSEKSS